MKKILLLCFMVLLLLEKVILLCWFLVIRLKEIPVLITGQVYSEFLSEEDWLEGKKAGVNVVGGDILKYWSKCMIELVNNGGKKKAIIKKHRSLPVKELNFEICDEGVKKKGWM